MTWTIKENDTRPAYVAQLRDNVGTGSEGPLNLTNATSVFFIMRVAGAPNDDPPKIKAAATITNAAQGTVTYTWAAGNTDTAGDYEVEFEVTWNDGGVETVPNEGYGAITIEEDLGRLGRVDAEPSERELAAAVASAERQRPKPVPSDTGPGVVSPTTPGRRVLPDEHRKE